MKTIPGNILAIERGLIMHQVNCVGATGGLAGALRRKWPRAFIPYFSACQGSASGTCVIAEGAPDLFIAHIFGQLQPGPCTDLALVDSALDSPALKALAATVPHYAPYLMGCGLGGGRWETYLPLLEKHLPELTIIQLSPARAAHVR